MKIAYIIYPLVVVSNKSNGIRSQAVTWAESLREKGIQVDLINNWGDYNWNDYDVIHLFSGGSWLYMLVKRLKKINPNVVWSPIIDPYQNKSVIYRLRSALERIYPSFLRTSYFYEDRNVKIVKSILTRSNYEARYVQMAHKSAIGKTKIIPLSCSPFVLRTNTFIPPKENFCLHISSIYQERKNVIRLIEAAKKYNFNLILAGNKGSDVQFEPIKNAIGDAKNIQVLGFVSEEQKIDLYKRAKVFALPSLSEGVGIVALDAAFYGCEIVITNIEGPKEYYGGKCIEVNPTSVDEIGVAVVKFIKDEISFQPELKNYLTSLYTPELITNRLIDYYKGI